MTTRQALPVRLRPLALALSACVAVLTALVFAGAAEAQEVPKSERSFPVHLWEAPIGGSGFVTLPGGDSLGHKRLFFSLSSTYQREPFTLETLQGPQRLPQQVQVVRDQIVTELTAAIGLFGKLQLGFALPFIAFQDGDDTNALGMPSGVALSGAHLGDLRIEGKLIALRGGANDVFSLVVMPALTLPTGKSQQYTGDKNVSGRIRLVGALDFDSVQTALLVGGLFRQPSESFAAKVGQQLMYGAAVNYRVVKGVSILGEVLGRAGLEDFTKGYTDANPMEVDLGMRVALTKMIDLTIGGGVGVIRGIGAPKFRGFLSLAWRPDFADRDGDGVVDALDNCPDSPEDRDGFNDDDGCPDLDNDGDGLLDDQDKCPLEPEDADEFQDEDGCPEKDNDGDGLDDIQDPCPNAAEDGGGKNPTDGCPSSSEDQDGDGVPDATDQCQDEPEDQDGFQDEDGCTDVDNDNDTIPDNFDECPNEAEDPDGIEDADGCPDPDNDRDGIPDVMDRCPNRPETLNGNRDTDGCPDAGAALVRLGDDAIEMRERVSFAGTSVEITRGSKVILNLVALIMKGNPEIARLRVEAAATGGTAETTMAQATAVVAYLVENGVEAERLVPKGVGEGRSQVSFVIEEKTSRRKATSPP